MGVQISEKQTGGGIPPLSLGNGPVPASIGDGKNADQLQQAMQEQEMISKNVALTSVDGKLLEETVKQNNENKENKNESSGSSGTNGTTSSKDSANISKNAYLHGLSAEELALLVKQWTLEMEGKIWEELLKWIPDNQKTPEEQLREIFEIYQKLLNAIQQNAPEEQKGIEYGRLNEALSKALNEFSEKGIANFTSMLNQFGSKEERTALKSGIYYLATKHTLPEKELKQFWDAGAKTVYENPKDIGKSFSDTSKRMGFFTEQGRIYSPAGKGTYRIQSGERENIWQQVSGKSEIEKERNGIFSVSENRMCSVADLKKADDWAGYITGKGNLYRQFGTSGKSEEFLGMITAIMDLKTQVYIKSEGIERPVGIMLKSNLDRLINFYLGQADEELHSEERRTEESGRFEPLRWKDIYKVYYEVMKYYQADQGKPLEAVVRGILMAMQMFYSKKRDSVFNRMDRYRENAEFFQGLDKPVSSSGEKSEAADKKEGKKRLENDWREFLKMIERERKKKIPPGLLDQSPWGMLIEPQKMSMIEYKNWMLVGIGITVAAVAAAAFWIR